MTLPDFLDCDSDGVIRIRGHRLRLIDIASSYEAGLSPEGICEFYDALSLPTRSQTHCLLFGKRS